MESHSNRVVRFGVFEADLDARDLRKHGLRLKLQDQPFQVLALLLERPGEIVTREDLQKAVWPEGTFVEFDHGLNVAVQKIRAALSDDASNPRFVETVPRRGYRFVAPVDYVERAPQQKPPSRRIAQPALVIGAIGVLVLAVYLAGWVGPQRVDRDASFPAPIPVTSSPGRDIHPGFSPGGDQITFTRLGPNSDSPKIYVKRLGEGRVDLLTDGTADDFNSVWSPDGRRIAFIRRFDEDSGAVMTIPAVGGPARKVLAIASGLPRLAVGLGGLVTWHPDGRHLVVAMADSEDGPLELHFVDADTGERRKLLAAESLFGDLDPAVSPDASLLAFRRIIANYSSEIRVVELSNSLEAIGESRRLTSESSPRFPTWTPDSRGIIFATGFGESNRLWRMTLDGEPKPLLQPSVASYPSVASTGRLAFSSQRRPNYDIWELILATREGSPVISSTFYDVTPQYSPDGSKIVFSSSRSGFREIWLCNRDGTNPSQLSNLKSRQSAMPYWSPDGSWIVFHSFVGNQRDIFLVRASGGEPRNLTDHPGEDKQPTVSRDGRWIYFSSDRSGQYAIWKIAPDGKEPIQVTSGGADQYALESVDRRTLYVSDGSNLWSMPTAGGPRRLEVEEFDQSLNWAVGRSGIYFGRRANTPRKIYFYDFDSGVESSVMEVERRSHVGFSLSPDGESILFTQGEPPESNIMLVEDFR